MRRVVLILCALALVLTGAPQPAQAAQLDVPVGKWDYQLGGAYPPPAGVTFVIRDRMDKPVAGLYNACYVNAFQAQEHEYNWWITNHPNLLLRDGAGRVVIDADWNEALLDIRTPEKRTALTNIVGGWFDKCAADGFKAIDPDNLDTYSRSQGLITQAHAIAYAKLLVDRAHRNGMPIAQKNAVELTGKIPFDFAVNEQCAQYNECAPLTKAYGKKVLEVEYRDNPYAKACAAAGRTWPVIRRDVNLKVAGKKGYVYKSC